MRRIHFIFERAGRKFRSDLSLWMRWIETCKRYKSTKQLSKVRGCLSAFISCPAAHPGPHRASVVKKGFCVYICTLQYCLHLSIAVGR